MTIRTPDVYFSPVPHRVVGAMLEIAAIGANDVVYDLGCGDGRILIAAAQKHGSRGVGVDLDGRLLAESRINARVAGVESLIEFLEQDFFATDLRPASVIALYLLDSVNVRLRPKILTECRPGTRVVSYSFEMGEWQPDAYTPIAANGVMLWIVPANLSGTWMGEAGGVGEIVLQQKFQHLSGTAVVNGERCSITEGRVNGSDFTLTLERASATSSLILSGRVGGDLMEGSLAGQDSTLNWTARRVSGRSCPLD